MRYLERLAVSALRRARGDTSTGAVRAVLPSRFATLTGGAPTLEVRSLLDDGQRDAAADESAQIRTRARSSDHLRVAPGVSPAGADNEELRAAADGGSHLDRAQMAPGTGRVVSSANGAGLQGRSPPERAAARATAGGEPADPAAGAWHAGAAGSPGPDALPPSRVEGGPSASLVSRAAGEATSAATRTLRGPLSDATVTTRLGEPRDEGPVIHVTIDRIDVRAPAARANAPAGRPRRPAPSVTLADYLRGLGRAGDQE